MRTRVAAGALAVASIVLVSACTSAGGRRASDRPPSRTTPHTVPVTRAPVTVASTTTTTLPPGPRAPVVSRVAVHAPVVFITIDDGYTRDPRVLALVKLLHLPITAFVIRGPALAGLAYWRALQAAGARIEDHTITHPHLQQLDLADQEHEVCGPLDEFATWFGTRPTLFRPPYGDYDEATRYAAATCGIHAVVLWRATLSDGKLAAQGGRLQPGDIILMHWRPTLYDDLVHLLALLRAQHLGVGQLEGALAAAGD